jgi:hypothetical protein
VHGLLIRSGGLLVLAGVEKVIALLVVFLGG